MQAKAPEFGRFENWVDLVLPWGVHFQVSKLDLVKTPKGYELKSTERPIHVYPGRWPVPAVDDEPNIIDGVAVEVDEAIIRVIDERAGIHKSGTASSQATQAV
ncbi:hypothetical protein A2943_02670 [Candidatus Adlerbacteria bacterium RIFCSPLOWO2_01_FULL_51_16]|uniref:Uncharacterized protein n=1 Tax=Candidatus Adlerbacteria bacterium RIFCSPLOWO2_01_FULL_51_16 TaxID=1797243 RepID=A0A1F4XGD7_9BACT|nr:MAG: hypothetical protein A2943_02670 [Candidatus Adlerbacteria bacterium RIFCSPLOWO2_01_FULL_51_16]